jgi:DNA-binding transcriptional MerR regulator
MTYTVHHIEREFSPREVEDVTGVSVTTQRDWRRRGLLPQKRSEGWSVFGLADVVKILVMKLLSDSGIPLKSASEIADLSRLPVLSEFRFQSENYAFEGMELTDEQRDRIMASSVVGASGRYLLVNLPTHGELDCRVARGDSLDALLASRGDGTATHYLVIDHVAVAERVVHAVRGPLYRISVEPVT